jgi:pilus assembly protein Flp/PilA
MKEKWQRGASPIDPPPADDPSWSPVGGPAGRGQAMRIREAWDQLIGDDAGATALEYALIAALIFLVILGAVQLLAGNVTDMYNTIANSVSNNM